MPPSASDSPEDATDSAVPHRQPVTHRSFQSLVERRIAEASAAGMFEHLPGVGKPLNLDDDRCVPEEDRAAFRLLKNAGFAPPWIELQKDIRTEQASLATWLHDSNRRWQGFSQREQTQRRTAYHQRLVALHDLIARYNMIVPSAVGQMPVPSLQAALARLGPAE